MKAELAIAAVLVAGCADPWDPGCNIPPGRLESALERWETNGLPLGWCPRLRDDTTIWVGLTAAELARECGFDMVWTGLQGCVMERRDDQHIHRYILIREGAPLEPTIEHEFRHLFAGCSGLASDGDPDHRDKRVWFEPMDDPGHYEYEGYRR